MNDDERREQGMAVRREVLGDEHVDRSTATATDVNADFQDFITRYAWGEIWSRPALARRDRSIAVISSLIALSHWDELPMHLRAALANGLTRQEIIEVILQSALYAGLPAANHAFAIANDTI